MWLHFFNQSNCDIYALIQLEMETQTSGPSVRDDAIFKTMWKVSFREAAVFISQLRLNIPVSILDVR